MTVKLNQAALAALLDTQDGPVGLLVQRKAAEVVEQARVNAGFIMHRYPPAVESIDFAMSEGPQAVVGVHDDGKKSSVYLADKAAGKITPRSPELFAEGWLKAALRGFGT